MKMMMRRGVNNMSITVEVRGGNLEKAMRLLKKKVMKEGIVKEMRAREYYQKPSEIKREKKKEGIKNYKKKMKKLEQDR
jgi:small subunit ribosomal protein S21